VATSIWYKQDAGQQLIVATRVGEAKEVGLSDGSSIDINTASNLQVNYNHSGRAVHLTNGEAVFSVAHDAERPFIVYAGQHQVRAIGTVFSVRLIDDQVNVTVTDGRVEINSPANTSVSSASVPKERPAAAVLVRGQSAMATPQGVKLIKAVDLQKIEQRLAWRDGMLDFSGETLAYTVNEIMRYTPYEIEIEAGGLGSRRIGGVFRIEDVDHFIEVLEESFDIEADQFDDNKFVLRSTSQD